MVSVDRYSFKDIPMDLLFNYQLPIIEKYKTLQRYLIGIS